MSTTRPFRVAYIMSRFPKLTETFILYEMLAVENKGVEVDVFPLLKENTTVMHPEAIRFVERANYQPFISFLILKAHLHFLFNKPVKYLQTIWLLLKANWGSLRFFTGVIGIFPKVVYFAYQMKKQGVDHVHAHFASHPAAAGFIIHRLVDIPYSFTAHGSDLHRDRHMLFEKVQAAAFVVAISEYNRELIINECQGAYSDKVAVIHCGVNADKFTFRIDETTHQKKLGEFKILCVGTLHEVKGQTYLIQACQKLLSAGINFSCHFIGDGPDKKVLSELVAKLDLNEKIVFHGRQTQDQIANFLQDVDVLVAPSVPTSDGRREGIPVVLIEAMSSGVPVIASNISGIPELVLNEQSGLLTPPRDSDALFIALERYYLDPGLRKRFAEAGRNTVINDFDLHQNAAKLVQKFRSESRL